MPLPPGSYGKENQSGVRKMTFQGRSSYDSESYATWAFHRHENLEASARDGSAHLQSRLPGRLRWEGHSSPQVGS